MVEGMPLKIGNRLGNRKTTTGCITCKIRRVKCDEAKPSCWRCTSTGRRCDGYRDPESSSRQIVRHDTGAVSYPDMLLSGSRLVGKESHAFHFFVDQGAAQIAGWRGAEFWCSLVPQLSQNYEAIQHATIALGSLLLRLRNQTMTFTATGSDAMKLLAPDAFALQHYGKAIQATLSTIKGGDNDDLLAAVTCILFVCIEALQSREEQAILFFRQGHISVLRSNGAKELASNQLQRSSAAQRAGIQAMFNRIAIQFMMFDSGNERLVAIQDAAFSIPLPESSQPLQTLIDAEDELLKLLSIVQGIAVVGQRLKWRPVVEADKLRLSALYGRRKLAQSALDGWWRRFQALRSEAVREAAKTTRSDIGASIILQQYHIMRIWLAGSLEVEECFYDQFTHEFETIVNEATSCAQSLAKPQDHTIFRLDMGWIPPLYWTALKCRHPILRRQALSLLDVGPRQEGLWDARLVKRVASRVIELEEAGIESSFEWNDKQEGRIAMPSEENRIKMVRINLRTTVRGQEGDVTEFHSLPNGLAGGWQIRREFIAA